MSPSGAFREHYAANQFRRETWNHLEAATDGLRRAAERGDAERVHVDSGAAERLGALRADVERTLHVLRKIEHYWAFPGVRLCTDLERLLAKQEYVALERHAEYIVRLLGSEGYRQRDVTELFDEDAAEGRKPSAEIEDGAATEDARPYFEVLFVAEADEREAADLRQRLLEMRGEDDEFIYDVVVVPSFEDAVTAVLFNHNIQSCVLRYRFPIESRLAIPELAHYLRMVDPELMRRAEREPCDALAEAIDALRPELDLFKVSDETVGSVSATRTRSFRRVFYRQEDYIELHLSILKGIYERYDTPFFAALKDYSKRPTGVFHALPISRGKSIINSHWIGDMRRFYGRNIFLAETSSTTGGLDSLLQPTGPLKRVQEQVARAFGSRHSFLVTNGTSTANKIVTQALLRPGDIVLLSHDCHKSHLYALTLMGAQPLYLEAYPLDPFAFFGGVPLREMKRQLLSLKRAGKLERVRMVLLTNSTFDGIVYDPERVMRELLAIKPDLVFVWDEAWFAFARATPTYRRRTGMEAARKLRAQLADEGYRQRYAAWRAEFERLDPEADATWLDRPLLPDPNRARVRVYVTQSTHKTLTSLRQGSMIHVHDQDFERQAREPFLEAYMTHTSTSPNYQILASLDVGRRQLELEGYELVRNCVGLAMMIRRQIVDHPLLRRYFKLLRAKDMIPAEYRPSGLEKFYEPGQGFTGMEEHWRQDEFALDPTRITLNIGATGMDGNTFRRLLIDRYDIQINKTSRNTVLFMVNIGSTRGSATYLLDVLLRVAEELDERAREQSELDRSITAERVRALVEHFPPLPTFSRFHPAFVDDPRGNTPEGDMRAAFFEAYEEKSCEHLRLDGPLEYAMTASRTVVSAAFVTPYPPGFPVLVPGQVVSADILNYLKAVDVKEIHGYEPEHGLRVFKDAVLVELVAKREQSRAAALEGSPRRTLVDVSDVRR